MATTTDNTDTDVISDVKQRENDQKTSTTEKQQQTNKKKNNNKRGGTKRHMSSLLYRQHYMRMHGSHPGGRPLHPPETNTTKRVIPMRYPGLPVHPRPFPPQKFGFFNEATPSVHPGHPGSEKRIYGGPPKQRLMMEGQTRVTAPKPAELKPPPSLSATSGSGKVEKDGAQPGTGASSLEVGNSRLMGPNEQQTGMNELFAKMIWKKLDMIQSPTRLNRLHTEIMNLLQQAIAEEAGK